MTTPVNFPIVLSQVPSTSEYRLSAHPDNIQRVSLSSFLHRNVPGTIRLTPQEARLLMGFLSSFGIPRPKYALLQMTRHPNRPDSSIPDYKIVDVLITRLRHHLHRAGWPLLIESIWGLGHRIVWNWRQTPRPTGILEPVIRDIRWTQAQKEAVLRLYEQAALNEDNDLELVLRREYPEVTAEILEHWRTNGTMETKI